ncbi:hypothetical protein [Streptomyces thermodiastaticus]|jgi:hypothetical protein|uniref:hypothetical protein n=1 Tax=Streptomyces thermodiastaticus TaxID=44061 RepID=UPI001677FBA3|nr:hypothetical protein [Streptomyces thermodiastaticus]MCE7550628.1 hypothetical protein [Streptomyces thermodiastaticus]GHF70677.1 hypothetical protein GCM10018787_18890 [Streptomyces thermodiastaticus]
MPALAIVSALFVVCFEQLVEVKYGIVGIVGLMLLSAGLKAKSPALSSVGAVVLAMLVAGPAL